MPKELWNLTRLSRFKYVKGYTPFDFLEYLRSNFKVLGVRHGTVVVEVCDRVVKTFTGVTNYTALLSAVEYFSGGEVVTFAEGTLLSSYRMSDVTNDKPKIYLDNLTGKGLPSLIPYEPDLEIQGKMRKVIAKHYGEEMADTVANGYVNSCNVQDPHLRTVHATLMAKDMPEPPTEDEIEDMAWSLFNQLSDAKEPVQPKEKITKNELYAKPLTSSSAGIMPLRGPNRTEGSKQSMKIPIVEGVGLEGIHPYKVVKKIEVLKVGKKVRHILIEPSILYLANMYFLGEIIKKSGDKIDGDFSGLSRSDGGFHEVLFYLYIGGGYESKMDFSTFLEEHNFNEADISAWDVSLYREIVLPYIFGLAARVKVDPEDEELWAQCLAHMLCPIASVEEGSFSMMWFLIASGEFITLRGNGEIQNIMWQQAVDACVRLGLITIEEAKTLKFVRVGDDTYAVDSPALQTVINYVRSKGKLKISSESGSLEETEFLRTCFKFEKQRLSTYRKPERLLAKLYHRQGVGNAMETLEAMAAATMEAGNNKLLNDCLHDMLNELSFDQPEGFEFSLNTKKTGGFVDGEEVRLFPLNEVLTRQAGAGKSEVRIRSLYEASK